MSILQKHKRVCPAWRESSFIGFLRILLLLLLSIVPAAVQAQDFTYTTNAGTSITVTGYTGSDTNISIPEKINGLPVTRIGDSSFVNLSGVTGITIPNSITNIGNNSFAFCDSLTSITIPKSITAIGRSPFYYCSVLTNIAVEAGNTAYSSAKGVLFDQPETTLIKYPEARSGNYAIPNTVTHLAGYAFYHSLKLSTITVPESVTSIGIYAFSYCASLTNLAVAVGNTAYSSLGGVLFDKPQTTLIQCPAGKTGDYVIPGSVSNVGNEAFYNCSGLASITIPDSVTVLGGSAFDGCASLKSLSIPDSVSHIGTSAFGNCTSLTNIVLSDSVSSIPFDAFRFCRSLTNITFSASITNIGDFAFAYCSGLKSLHFEGDAPDVGGTSLFFRTGIVTVHYLPASAGWSGSYAGMPTAPWLPEIRGVDGTFGLVGGLFGFNVRWAPNQQVVVEGADNLANPNWKELVTLNLTNGTARFTDSDWTNHSMRFYRLREP